MNGFFKSALWAPLLVIIVGMTSQPVRAEEDKNWLVPLYELRTSVVHVASASYFSAGIIISSHRHVIVPFYVIEEGRDIEVTSEGGQTSEAEVIAIDKDKIFALLELTTPFEDRTPLDLSNEKTEIGDGVALLQPTYPDLETRGWAITPGVIIGFEDKIILTNNHIQAQTWEQPFGGYGSPLLSKKGKVLGIAIASDRGVLEVVPAEQIKRLFDEVRLEPGDYKGNYSFKMRMGWSFLIDFGGVEPIGLHGPTISLATVLWDRLVFDLQYTMLVFDMQEETPEEDTDVSGMIGSLDLGYRFLLTGPDSILPIYMTPSIGVAIMRKDTNTTTLAIEENKIVHNEDSKQGEIEVFPTVKLNLVMGRIIDLGVGVQLDVKDLTDSNFMMFLGFGF